MNYHLTAERFREEIIDHLLHTFGVTLENAGDETYYKAVALVVSDLMRRGRSETEKRAKATHTKQVYYLCMEFLLGRSLKNNLFNLGLEESAREALRTLGVRLDALYDQEPDAGLGNGGLGRLAACFLDSLSTQGYAAMGYSLRYEYGIFRQKLVDGWQTELPDFWLPGGKVWLQEAPEKAVEVHFDGHVEEAWYDNHHTVNHKDYTKVLAVPYDMCISGKDGRAVSKLRLWAARSSDFDMKTFNSGNYLRAVEQNAMAEVITKVLYPEDNNPEGKSLRLSQQYFLVSATIQDIIRRHLFEYGTLDSLPELTAIHLNDTHPVLAVPELMRIMLDECGYGWEAAWDIVSRTVAYTNHTVMKEALECWNQDLFRLRLPRIYQIVEEINRRFCADMHGRGVDGYKVGRMAPLNDGFVKMANLAVVGAHHVNGVSALHSEILKETVFRDFYQEMPGKFTNVTNGIAYRRWVAQANPGLAAFLEKHIGGGYLADAAQLEKLLPLANDGTALRELEQVKRENKQRAAGYLKKAYGAVVNPDSIFDIQVKRLHEYKRQHLNALHILSLYLWLKEHPQADFTPRTFIFGAKAAPGYYFAKQIIRFIVKLGEMIDADPAVREKLKIVYVEDYRVTLAELLIPAADISEQISLAGTEASGTSNMKFMINGAVTLGTLDGANVEIHEAVGDENIILFGMTTEQAEALRQSGYRPGELANNHPVIRQALQLMENGFGGMDYKDLASSLRGSDPYMVLADFDAYAQARQRAEALYRDRQVWNRMCLTNIAKAGRFSADRAIREYAQDIWHADPIPQSPVNKKG